MIKEEVPERRRSLDLEERMDLAERDLRDHSKSLTAHNDAIREQRIRITAIRVQIKGIEEARRTRELVEARKEERDGAREIALNLRLDMIDKSINAVQLDVKSIRGAGGKLAWIIITLVIGIIVAFAFKGGFLIST